MIYIFYRFATARYSHDYEKSQCDIQSHSYDKVAIMRYKVAIDIHSHNYEILSHILRYEVAILKYSHNYY